MQPGGMELMSAFSKEANASLVDPDFIAGVRKKLDLGQREAGAIFGRGVNAFSSYENGKTKPSVALVKLLNFERCRSDGKVDDRYAAANSLSQ